MKILLSLFAVFLVAGCAVGPLVSHETARTVGRHHHELIGGLGVAGHVLKWNFGLMKNLDLGLHWESLSMGLRAKYAFVNKDEGWSWAAALGTGASDGGSHKYADIIGSYLAGAWEPYGTVRFVHVKTDEVEIKGDESGWFRFTVPASNYDYTQFILGTRYWFSSHWLLSFEVSTFSSVTSGIEIEEGVLAGVSYGYRF